jgi:HPt (histidine-containing phosphotransfer) domain-containing protein
MTPSLQFLPGFDVMHIEHYFFNDTDAIREIFKITHDNLGGDMAKIPLAIDKGDIEGLRSVLHTIKPIFNFIGLPAIEENLNRFYELSKQVNTVEELQESYEQLWPELMQSLELIGAQNALFEAHSNAMT